MSLLKFFKKVDPVTASVGNDDATHVLEVSGQVTASVGNEDATHAYPWSPVVHTQHDVDMTSPDDQSCSSSPQ